MRYSITILFALVALSLTSIAQPDSLFVRVRVITLSDTLQGFINRDINLERFIELKRNLRDKSSNRIGVDSIQNLRFRGMEFTRIAYQGESFLARVEAEGLVCIYTDFRSGSSFVGGGSFQSGYFVDRIERYIRFEGRVHQIRSATIRKLIDEAFTEDPDMADRLMGLKYTQLIDSLPAFAREYNHRYADFLPGGQPIPLIKIETDEISRLGFYIPIAASYPLVYVTQKAKDEMFNASRGHFGFSVGLGFYYSLSAKARVYFDASYYTTSMYLDYGYQPSSEINQRVKEDASFGYITLSPKLEFSFEGFSTGFGVSFSVYDRYRSSYSVFAADGSFEFSGNESNPLLIKDSKNVVSFSYYVLKTFKLGVLSVSPLISISIPANNTFDIGERYLDVELQRYMQEGVMPFQVSLGTRIEL
ncbi:MAG: hypothetical protein RBT74_15510 [Tenuifilaceae bacterium]|jgi:hypothetical protein|nr:hypothetical protein [Tenuifilaceae bacterium]